MSKKQEKDTEFNTFYQQHQQSNREFITLAQLAKEQKFNQSMKNGKTVQIIEWNKLVYRVLGIAMLLKGVSYLSKN